MFMVRNMICEALRKEVLDKLTKKREILKWKFDDFRWSESKPKFELDNQLFEDLPKEEEKMGLEE